jgi:membrane protein DedA with SNARE-associated domain
MCLESTALPLPSELILPFSGWILVKDSSIVQITILTIIASVGSVSGSLIEYFIAKTLGRAFFKKYGKYILFDENDLNKAESFFKKYGSYFVFWGRFIPGIRGFIAIPAGLTKMNIYKFSILTFAGSFPWIFIYIYLGNMLGENYLVVQKYIKPIEIPLLLILFCSMIFFFCYKFYKIRKKT